MLSAAIAEYLTNQGFDPVFVEHLPEEPSDCAAVYTRPGAPPLTRLGSETAAIQVLVRGSESDPRAGYRLALDIYNCLHNLAPDAPIGTTVANQERVQLVAAVNSGPYRLGQDTHGRYEWTINFSVRLWNPDRR